jgi:hypothetical protein
LDRKLGPTTDLFQSFLIALHLGTVCERLTHFAKYLSGMDIGWFYQAIVHPFAVATGRHQAGASEISKVSRDFWLVSFQDLNKKTDADLVVSY